MAKVALEIESLGASLVLISPMTVENSREFAEKKKLDVAILRDPGNETAAIYGIRYALPPDLKALYQKFGIHLDQHNGEDSWTLPMPARLIIDAEGIVRYAEINPDYTHRPEPEETVAALKGLLTG